MTQAERGTMKGQCEWRFAHPTYNRALGDFLTRCGNRAARIVDGRNLCAVHAHDARQETR